MICEPFTVVTVPFPFSDLPRAKSREALVLSDGDFNRRNGASILMMITSAARSQWHLDVPLKAWSTAGLRKPCVARPKLFTLDNRLIAERVGALASEDIDAVVTAIRQVLPLTRDPSSHGLPQPPDVSQPTP